MNLPPAATDWDIERLTEERTEAVSAFGFTERQARFLVGVLVHSGVFVERQYCAFAGITHGQKTTDFLRRLVERGYARPVQVGALHRGRLFHVHHKPLYAAIGETNNRHRKPMALGRMVERLMVLDAVLGDRNFVWLGTEFDKRSYFLRRLQGRVELREFPRLTFGSGGATKHRYFPDKLPIGIERSRTDHVPITCFSTWSRRPYRRTFDCSCFATPSYCGRCFDGLFAYSFPSGSLARFGCSAMRRARNSRPRSTHRLPRGCSGSSQSASVANTRSQRLSTYGFVLPPWHTARRGTERSFACGSRRVMVRSQLLNRMFSEMRFNAVTGASSS